MEHKYCPACGCENSADARFCESCAKPLVADAIPPQQPVPPPYYLPRKQPGSTTALVLGIVGIVSSQFFWPLGFVLAGAGLILAITDKSANTAAKVVSIIGLILSFYSLIDATLYSTWFTWRSLWRFRWWGW